MNDLGKSWYTKYTPKTLEEYSGPSIKNIVSKRFKKREDFPHCIYIKGPRGTGKTTFARLITKYYLCENPKDDGTPCETCEMCQQINDILISGNSIDVECAGVTEIDATTANGKEAIQEVMEDAIQSPIYTKYKIVIFDECHMITAQAQNALLKLIEDIPQHLICIFCTTNDEKVLQTIKSRMQLTLEARKQTVQDMSHRLLEISKMENLTVSKEALDIISRKGNRVPRECINLLEGIAKTYDGDISIANVRDYLGGVSSDLYMEYFNVANTGLADILLFIKKLRDNDVKLKEFSSGLMQFALDSMYIKHGISLEDFPSDYVKSVKQLFVMYNNSDFDMLLQILEYLSNNLTEEDNAKNEVLLTITAMRISKINLLANGLAEEQSQSIIENKESLYEHSKKLKINNEDIIEQTKIEINPTTLKETLGEIRQVVNTEDLLKNVSLPDFEDTQEKREIAKPKNIDLGDAINEFFDN